MTSLSGTRSFLGFCAGIVFAHGATAQTFLRTNGLPDRQERGLVLHRSASGSIFLGGNIADSALVQRIDVNGQILWSRAFKVPGQEANMVYQFSDGPDGTIIGCGNGVTSVSQPREAFHFKFSEDGVFHWIRYWEDPTAYNRAIFANGPNELLMLSCYYETGTGTTWADYFQSKVDPETGAATWVSGRQDLFNAVPYIDDATAAVRHAGEFYVTGRIYTNGSPLSTCRVNLTKVDAQGEHLWTRYLLYPNNVDRRMYGSDIISNDDSLTIACYGNINGSTGVFSIGLIRSDTEGNISWARNYDIVGSTSELCTKVLATSFGYVVAGRTLGAGFQRAFLLAVSPTGDVLWSRVYGLDGSVHMAPHLYVKNLIALDDGFMFTWAERNGADDDLLLARTDVQGLMACGDVADIEVVTTELPEVTFDPATMAFPLSIALDADASAVGPASLVEECDIALDLGPDTAICGQLTLYASVPGSSQVWQDGSTADSLVVTNAGTFWVTVTMDCCTRTDTIEVVAGAFAGLDLGPDTALCGDGTMVLDVGQPWDETVWSDGTEGSVFVVEEPGTYWVHVLSGACSGSDTIIVGQTGPPAVDIGPDTVICDGDVLVLAAQQSGLGYLWSDGSGADSLLVTAPGMYWVEVGSLGCSTIDSVIVQVSPVPVIDLGPDTICCGTVSVTLASGYAGSNTSWSSTPDPIPSILVIVPGTYWVQVSVDGCEASDTVAIGVQQLPLVVLISDTTLCEPTVLEIAPLIAEGGPVTWSDGSGASTLIVDSAGTWSATVENACGSSIDEVTINMAEWMEQPGYFSTCPGEPVRIELPEGVSEVLWSTGSDQATVYLSEGTYVYQLLDAFGCPRQGQIIVSSDEDGNGLAFVPNVFTPNADGWNDTFKVVGAAFDRFELSIFNRWGEHIFHSTDPGKEWDGNFKGRAVPDGTYVYLLRYVDRCEGGVVIDRPGHVTLLR